LSESVIDIQAQIPSMDIHIMTTSIELSLSKAQKDLNRLKVM
jgi:hypothetical protein